MLTGLPFEAPLRRWERVDTREKACNREGERGIGGREILKV